MKTIMFKKNVTDKNTNETYIKNQVKEFNNKRADEILKARDKEGKPYAEEIKPKK
ncbi:MAG: hypothetical protein J6K45_04925 [Clostridia bacterium]|nr:hypothetical protein [Clostridia bacterium]